MTCLLKENKFECRVSSVLNNSRAYGKCHMFDDSDETCWNSDAGTPQWVIIRFDEECSLTTFCIQFQGGFAGKECSIEVKDDQGQYVVLESFYPEDINSVQHFNLKKPIKAKTYRLMFHESTDLFGRIIIYKLSLYS